MRPFLVCLFSLTAPLLVLSAPIQAQRMAIKPQSSALQASGDAQLRAGNPSFATDLYEVALAVDPRNVAAYVGLGRASAALGLDGKALSYYRRGLSIDPNNLDALQAQAIGLAAKGQVPRAQANLERMRKLCKAPCAAATPVEAAINKAQSKSVANTSSGGKKPASR
jgi:tetratricopeptide (TPR) repeat protein